jgi:hypothetical protein
MLENGIRPVDVSAGEQLAALERLHELFQEHQIEYWLFGGWAVDFHAGGVTRAHADLDIAVWQKDQDRIATLLTAESWIHAPEPDEDGYTGYVRDAVRLEVAFLARAETGEVFTPLREGQGRWADGAFQNDVAELQGVQARIINLSALKAEKSESRADPVVATKDRLDSEVLSRLESGA